MPNASDYNIIAFASQEVVGESDEQIQTIEDYLARDFRLVEKVHKGQILLAVFVKISDMKFLVDIDKQFITKDKVRIINYGFKGGVMI